MFRASLCPSSGAQEYYTVVAACGISCCKNVKNNFVSFCGNCVLSLKCRVFSRFVTRCVESRGCCVWLFLVGVFVVYSLVCGSGIPFVVCDFMTVDVVDSCMNFPHINDDSRSKSRQTRDLSVFRSIQKSYGAHLAFYSIITGALTPE